MLVVTRKHVLHLQCLLYKLTNLVELVDAEIGDGRQCYIQMIVPIQNNCQKNFDWYPSALLKELSLGAILYQNRPLGDNSCSRHIESLAIDAI